MSSLHLHILYGMNTSHRKSPWIDDLLLASYKLHDITITKNVLQFLYPEITTPNCKFEISEKVEKLLKSKFQNKFSEEHKEKVKKIADTENLYFNKNIYNHYYSRLENLLITQGIPYRKLDVNNELLLKELPNLDQDLFKQVIRISYLDFKDLLGLFDRPIRQLFYQFEYFISEYKLEEKAKVYYKIKEDRKFPDALYIATTPKLAEKNIFYVGGMDNDLKNNQFINYPAHVSKEDRFYCCAIYWSDLYESPLEFLRNTLKNYSIIINNQTLYKIPFGPLSELVSETAYLSDKEDLTHENDAYKDVKENEAKYKEEAYSKTFPIPDEAIYFDNEKDEGPVWDYVLSVKKQLINH